MSATVLAPLAWSVVSFVLSWRFGSWLRAIDDAADEVIR